jgi:tRNA 5-methylaminomethyl-2-thiouridine biosynthesis bifunctional protein
LHSSPFFIYIIAVMDTPKHLLNDRYDDRYFDVVNAIQEAKQLHIEGACVIDRLAAAAAAGGKFRIGETGFGAGRLLVALMDSLEAGGVAGAEVDYCSVELYPVSIEKMRLLLGGLDCRPRHIENLTDAYSRIDTSVPGWHRAVLSGDFGVINLRLFIGEALDMAVTLDDYCDAWFLDGHAPSKNPEMWRAELLSAIGAKSAAGATVTTFTAAGYVRRNLIAAGFCVQRVPGYGGKKEALKGVFLGNS